MTRQAVGAAAWLTLAVLAAAVTPARADGPQRFALIVSGADGGPEHAANHARWREALARALVERLHVPAEHVMSLHDGADPSTRRLATRDAVRAAFETFVRGARAPDLLLVVLIGHGTFDGVDAKFNLVGPDLESADWRALVDPFPGTVVFVNAASASFPFLSRIAGPRRVVISATSSPAQRFGTVFAEFLGDAFADAASDLDKDGRVSIGEWFTYAATHAAKWYAQRGILATEQALLDDNGDGVGQPAGELGADGSLASRLFLDPDPDAQRSTDPAVSELIARRDQLERQIDEVKRKKGFMPPDDYARELERLLVDLARLSQRIRKDS